jgi:hypothetical protein
VEWIVGGESSTDFSILRRIAAMPNENWGNYGPILLLLQ